MSKPLTGVKADHAQSYRNLERIAALVRKQLNIGPDEAIQPLAFFEKLDDIQIVRAPGSAIPLRHGVITLEGSEGYTKYVAERQVIEVLASEETYQGLELRRARAGYFVAHELGHCLLHTDQLVRLAQMPTNQQAAFHRGKTEHRAFEDTEWQANAFAGALLMPALGLLALEQERGGLTVPDISDRFGVSHEAAGYRLDLWASRRDQLIRTLGSPPFPK